MPGQDVYLSVSSWVGRGSCSVKPGLRKALLDGVWRGSSKSFPAVVGWTIPSLIQASEVAWAEGMSLFPVFLQYGTWDRVKARELGRWDHAFWRETHLCWHFLPKQSFFGEAKTSSLPGASSQKFKLASPLLEYRRDAYQDAGRESLCRASPFCNSKYCVEAVALQFGGCRNLKPFKE